MSRISKEWDAAFSSKFPTDSSDQLYNTILAYGVENNSASVLNCWRDNSWISHQHTLSTFQDKPSRREPEHHVWQNVIWRHFHLEKLKLEWPVSQITEEAALITSLIEQSDPDTINEYANALLRTNSPLAQSQLLQLSASLDASTPTDKSVVCEPIRNTLLKLRHTYDESLQTGIAIGIKRLTAILPAEDLPFMLNFLTYKATTIELSSTLRSLAIRFAGLPHTSIPSYSDFASAGYDIASQFSQKRLINAPANHAVYVSAVAQQIALNCQDIADKVDSALTGYFNPYLLRVASSSISQFLTNLDANDERYSLLTLIKDKYVIRTTDR